MDIIKILAIAILTCIATLIVKQVKPDFASLVAITGGIVILLMLIDYVNEILSVFQYVIEKSGLSPTIFTTILKIIGVGYLTEFTANICIDSGSSSLASKVTLAGKIIILFMSLPIITNIIDIIAGILPWKKFCLFFVYFFVWLYVYSLQILCMQKKNKLWKKNL